LSRRDTNSNPNFCPVTTRTCRIPRLFGHVLKCKDLEKENGEQCINFEKVKVSGKTEEKSMQERIAHSQRIEKEWYK